MVSWDLNNGLFQIDNQSDLWEVPLALGAWEESDNSLVQDRDTDIRLATDADLNVTYGDVGDDYVVASSADYVDGNANETDLVNQIRKGQDRKKEIKEGMDKLRKLREQGVIDDKMFEVFRRNIENPEDTYDEYKNKTSIIHYGPRKPRRGQHVIHRRVIYRYMRFQLPPQSKPANQLGCVKWGSVLSKFDWGQPSQGFWGILHGNKPYYNRPEDLTLFYSDFMTSGSIG